MANGNFQVNGYIKVLNRFQEHVKVLCKQNKIRYIVRPGRGQAKVRKKTIYLPAIKTIKLYFIALHEIGHVVIGLEPPKLERERLAWEWALKIALVKPSQDMQQVICALLVRHMFEAPEEKPSEEYMKLVKWWEA